MFGQTNQKPYSTLKLPNYFSVTADMTSATWNTLAKHEIATVTGMVHMVVIPECTATLTDTADGASIQFGHESDTAALIASTAGATAATLIATGDIWVDATPTEVMVLRTPLAALDFVIAGGLDVGYEITGAALTGGTIVFHVWYEPLNSTGAVVAGAGGVL